MHGCILESWMNKIDYNCKDCKWFGINNVCNNYYSEYCGLEVFPYMHKCTSICVMCLNTKNTKKEANN